MKVQTKHAIEHELDDQAKAARSLIEILRERDLDDDAELVVDTVEGETGLLEALDAALAEIDSCDVVIEGCKARESDLSARRSRAAARKDKVRAAIEQALFIAEIGEKVQRPTATLSLSKRKPSLVIDDESAIPAEFFVSVPKLDKKALGEAASERTIPGCHMSNAAPTLTIRRK